MRKDREAGISHAETAAMGGKRIGKFRAVITRSRPLFCQPVRRQHGPSRISFAKMLMCKGDQMHGFRHSSLC